MLLLPNTAPPMIDKIVSSSLSVGCNWSASAATPQNSPARIVPSSSG